MSKSVWRIVTLGSSAGNQPKVDLVLSQAAGGFTDQEVAENAAIAGNSDPSPSLMSSNRIDASGSGVVDSDITSGIVGSPKFYYVQTRKADNSIIANNILSGDKQQGFSAYAGGTTYALNATVDYGSNSYISLQNANTGHQPDISPTWWRLNNKSANARAVAEGISIGGGGSIGLTNTWLEGLAITIDAS